METFTAFISVIASNFVSPNQVVVVECPPGV